MDRRKSLKLIATGAIASGAVAAGCTTSDEKDVKKEEPAFNFDRAAPELERDTALMAQTFFTKEEMETITVLADIIIPADEVSGSASQAGVPAFIEYIVKDMPRHQVPMRGGLRWLNLQCLKRYEKPFVACSPEQRIEIVEQIAYPNKAKKEMAQGVAFFSLMRNLTATGFYTSEMGVKDIGYAGNKPNQWNGVPAEVLAQYNMAYSEKELKECLSF